MSLNPSHLIQPDDGGHDTNTQYRSSDDFVVIWTNLSHIIDLTRWYHLFRRRLPQVSRNSLTTTTIPESAWVTTAHNHNERVILDRDCGHAASRQITAVMGPSGVGKSSLLNCLFQGLNVGTSGEILVEAKSNKKLKVCFIPQHDHMNEWLTVREDLMFVSKLKQNKLDNLVNNDDRCEHIEHELQIDSSNNQVNSYVRRQKDGEFCSSLINHDSNVHHVAKLLGISNCLDVTIKNISGGERKRLSIARELMSRPDILVLDEPTTGLDSLTCYKTVMVLRDLVRQSSDPMAIVVTIHQPEESVFNLFDRVHIIAKGGKTMYDGNPKNAVHLIETVAKTKLPTRNYNPASFLIEISSDDSYQRSKNLLIEYHRDAFEREFTIDRQRKIIRGDKSQRSVLPTWLRSGTDVEESTSNGKGLAKFEVELSNSYPGTSDLATPTLDAANIRSIDCCGLSALAIPSKTYYVSPQLRNCLDSHSNSLRHSFWQISILTHRSWLSIIRNRSLTQTKLLYYTLLPAVMLFVFGSKMGGVNRCPSIGQQSFDLSNYRENFDENTIAQNVADSRLMLENVSFFFILIYGFAINIIAISASYYPLTLNMFKKEVVNGLYSTGPYYIGQTLAELPLEVFIPFLSIVASYQLSGQQSSFMEWRMFSMAFVICLVCLVHYGIGLLTGLIFSKNISVSMIVGQAALTPFLITSGFVIRVDRMASLMRTFAFISPFLQAFKGIAISRYGFNVCDCNEKDFESSSEFLPPNVKSVMGYMFPPGSDMDGLNVTDMFDRMKNVFVKSQSFGIDITECKDVKPYVLHIYSFADHDLFISIGSLLTWIICLRVLIFLILRKYPYRIN